MLLDTWEAIGSQCDYSIFGGQKVSNMVSTGHFILPLMAIRPLGRRALKERAAIFGKVGPCLFS